MPKRQAKVPLPPLQLDPAPSSLQLLKRAQLQQFCKRFGLRGAGKNTELLQRLQQHLKQTGSSKQVSPRTPPPAPDTEDVKQEEQAGGRGWCVVHGQELTVACWFPLSLRCGRACVSSQGLYVPLHLAPSSRPTPPGLTDNLICGECLERNQKKDNRLQESVLQDNSNLPKTSTIRSSFSFNRNRSGRFQPQEDPEYARRVDDLLYQMASGQMDSQKVLQPIQPAVLHSPLAKQEHSPIPINL